jgi:uncharacterized membrane protein
MTPMLELRAAIPLGYFRFHLSIIEATIVSILGVIVSTMVVLYLLPFFVDFFKKRIPFLHKILDKIFQKTRAEHSKKIEILGDIFLITFVAIPLPGSGGWTGALIAYLFGTPYKKAIKLVSIGVIFSGIIVAALTLFGGEIFHLISVFFSVPKL